MKAYETTSFLLVFNKAKPYGKLHMIYMKRMFWFYTDQGHTVYNRLICLLFDPDPYETTIVFQKIKSGLYESMKLHRNVLNRFRSSLLLFMCGYMGL